MKKVLFTLMGLLAFGATHAADLAPMSAEDAAAVKPAEAKPAEAPAAAESHGTVARAVFTSGISNREPTSRARWNRMVRRM